MVTATITSKGQITLPKRVRDSLRLHTGDRIEFLVRGQTEAVLKPVTKTVDEVFGRLSGRAGVTRTVEEMNEAIARRIRGRRR